MDSSCFQIVAPWRVWGREICKEQQWIGSLNIQVIAVLMCHLGYSGLLLWLEQGWYFHRDGQHICTAFEYADYPLHFSSFRFHALYIGRDFFFLSSSSQHRLVEKPVLSCPLKDRRWKKAVVQEKGIFFSPPFFFLYIKLVTLSSFSRFRFFIFNTLHTHTHYGTAKPEHTVWQKDTKQAWLCGKVFSGDPNKECRLHHQALLVSKESCPMATAA